MKILPGSGDNFTNWIHLDDIAGAVEFALAHRLQGIYNLVNDVPETAGDLFDRMCELQALAKVEWDASLPPLRPQNVCVSNQKLKAAGYRFAHSETLV